MRSNTFSENGSSTVFVKHILQFVGKDEYMVDELDIYKGRVSEVNNCEYQAGTYIPPDMVEHYTEHVNIMTPIVG
eukprot:15352851-Ditylum_brightwellii.AAC.1